MSDIVASCRHPKEVFRSGLTLVVGGLVWLLLGLFIVVSLASGKIAAIVPVLVYGLLYLFSLLRAALARAHAFGHNVLLGERQLPELHRVGGRHGRPRDETCSGSVPVHLQRRGCPGSRASCSRSWRRIRTPACGFANSGRSSSKCRSSGQPEPVRSWHNIPYAICGER